MKFATFHGGIHPDDKKAATKDVPIKHLAAPEVLVFPLWQSIGAPCLPLVKVGDHVRYGQKIGDSEKPVSAPVHASVSGTVTAIEPRLTIKGVQQDCVVVKNDFKDEFDPSIKMQNDPTIPDRGTIIQKVREAGIIGLGGAGFPTHIKMSPKQPEKIDTIIINGAECEPYITSDYRILMETPEYVTYGLKCIQKVFGVQNGVIAIEENKLEAVPRVEKHLGPGMRVQVLKTKYPQGSEKQLIWSVTRREVPEGGLPADVGVVVFNIDTATSIARAVKRNMPVTRRIITVSGGAVTNPCNFLTRTGTMVDYIFSAAGGFKAPPARVIAGGPMMGTALYNLSVPVVKTTSALLALTKEECGEQILEPCLRCGKCVDACPMHLSPVELNRFALAEDWEKCEKLGVKSCMECGTCAYLCPSSRQPVQAIRRAKQALAARKNS